jgi:hypothetical protein
MEELIAAGAVAVKLSDGYVARGAERDTIPHKPRLREGRLT